MARRDRNAALAGLAALGALMYARSRKGDESEKKSGEEVKAARPSTATDQPDLSSLPTTPPLGASSDAGERQTSRVSSPARAKPAETAAPAAPAKAEAKPASGGARSTGIGGATAAQMREYYSSAAKAAPKAGTGSGRGGRGGPEIGEVEEYERRRRLMTPGVDAVESDFPEANLLAPGLKTVAGAAKALASRSPKLKEYVVERIGHEPLKIGREPLKLGMKKGGAVKKMASGGMARSSSASRRADGIAQRGKTRGKVY